MKIKIIKEARGRKRKAAAQQPEATTMPLGYSEDDNYHLFAVKLEQFDMGDPEATKTWAINTAKMALQEKGVDISDGYKILRTGFSDGVLVIGVLKRSSLGWDPGE